eukprot:m.4988 g.4988  ORF g.4988 m.4988 type:complete len:50 (+) comp4752_c0_seq1:1-150(+)
MAKGSFSSMHQNVTYKSYGSECDVRLYNEIASHPFCAFVERQLEDISNV